jgi:hypothetical protein
LFIAAGADPQHRRQSVGHAIVNVFWVRFADGKKAKAIERRKEVRFTALDGGARTVPGLVVVMLEDGRMLIPGYDRDTFEIVATGEMVKRER